MNGGAPGISASFLNAVENVLEQPSGGTETGKYYFTFWAAASSDTAGIYCPSLSRTSVPVSVTIDHADAFPAGINAPATSNITANGFEVFSGATAGGTNYGVGGNTTINY